MGNEKPVKTEAGFILVKQFNLHFLCEYRSTPSSFEKPRGIDKKIIKRNSTRVVTERRANRALSTTKQGAWTPSPAASPARGGRRGVRRGQARRTVRLPCLRLRYTARVIRWGITFIYQVNCVLLSWDHSYLLYLPRSFHYVILCFVNEEDFIMHKQ